MNCSHCGVGIPALLAETLLLQTESEMDFDRFDFGEICYFFGSLGGLRKPQDALHDFNTETTCS